VIAAMLYGVAPGMLPGDHVDPDACIARIGPIAACQHLCR